MLPHSAQVPMGMSRGMFGTPIVAERGISGRRNPFRTGCSVMTNI